MNLIVINDTNKISIEKLRMIPNNNYMIISYDELIRIPDELIFGCIVFVLGNNENEARILLNEAKRIQQKENCNVIVVAKENYFDIDEDRYLSDYTEYGKKISIMLQEERLC